MKLAILGSRGFPSTYGGYETLVRHLAPYVARAGHTVTVYCRDKRYGQRTWVDGDVYCVATPGYDSHSLSTLSFGVSATAHAVASRFDAVLILNIANGFWLPALRSAGIPTVVNTDGLEWERKKWPWLGRQAFRVAARLTARYADTLICDSLEIGRIWKEKFGRDSSYIPYGADLLEGASTEGLERLGVDKEKFLLVVARLVPENNVDLALDAFEQLDDLDLVGVVVGGTEPGSPLYARLTTLQKTGRLVWLGHVVDQRLLTELWANCAVYVHGHSVGGTNPALLQAMGAGAPVLALNTSFNAEVLRNDTALFTGEPGALAAKIRALRSDHKLRHGMEAHNQRQIEERFSWDDVCGNYMAVLERISRVRANH